jgi:hypothetical protein
MKILIFSLFLLSTSLLLISANPLADTYKFYEYLNGYGVNIKAAIKINWLEVKGSNPRAASCTVDIPDYNIAGIITDVYLFKYSVKKANGDKGPY